MLAGTAQNALAGPITSPADPALVGGTLVDFNSAPLGSFSSQTFGGVTIAGNMTISDDGNGIYAPPAPQGDRFLDNRLGGPFEFTFSSLISAFGMQIGATNDVQQLTAYDALNNVIEFVTIPDQVSGPEPWTGYYGIAAPGIKRVTLTGNLGDWVVVDDLTYNGGSQTVPDPGSSLLLLGLGLAGLRAWKNRLG